MGLRGDVRLCRSPVRKACGFPSPSFMSAARLSLAANWLGGVAAGQASLTALNSGEAARFKFAFFNFSICNLVQILLT